MDIYRRRWNCGDAAGRESGILETASGNSDYIEFYDKNGEMVATYSNNGWTMYTTNAEASRQTEMCMTYKEAWGNTALSDVALNILQGDIFCYTFAKHIKGGICIFF